MAKQCWSQTVLESGSWGHSVLQTPALVKYSIYANIFAEKMSVAFAFAKATHIFSAKIPVNLVLYLLEQLTF